MFAQALPLQSTRHLALYAVIAFAAMTASGPVLSASTSATASATILAPMTISSATSLSFGSFDASTAGTVTVDTAGHRTASGVRLSGGTPAAASFLISGQSGLSYNIAYTGTSATLSNGGDSMALSIVSDLGNGASGASAPVSSGILSSGSTTLRVGGTLIIDAGTPPGAYSGTISVTVQYQ